MHIRSQNRKGPEPVRPEANAGGVGGSIRLGKAGRKPRVRNPICCGRDLYFSPGDNIAIFSQQYKMACMAVGKLAVQLKTERPGSKLAVG